MDLLRGRVGSNLLLKPSVENRANNVMAKRTASSLNSSLVQQPKRTAFNNINNITKEVTAKLVNETAKLSLKLDKEKPDDLIKPSKPTDVVIKSRLLPKPLQPIRPQVSKVKSCAPSTQSDVSSSKIPRPIKSLKPETTSFSSTIIPEDVENIDEEDHTNVFLVADYVNDIYSYLRCLENKYKVKSDYLANSREFTPKMRSVLVDWLISVHYQFHLTAETLYMAVALFDRFCQNESVAKNKIQLVGVTAMFIASKYEEIYPPEMEDFVRVCDGVYHKRDIIKMEISMLKGLAFELGRPLPLHFLRRMSKAAHADAVIHLMAKYLMELCLLEYDCAHWDPSLLAATALYTSLKMFDNKSKWTSTLRFYSLYNEEQLRPHVTTLCTIIQKAPNAKLQNCRKKYATTKFTKISKRPELESQVVTDMAKGVFASAKKSSPN